MNADLRLVVRTADQALHDVYYQLADNVVAKKWFEKIYYLQDVPLCGFYTNDLARQPTLEEINQGITDDLIRLQALDLPELDQLSIKTSYDHDDCNLIHHLTVRYQYGFDLHTRNIFHSLHRKIHLVEIILEGYPITSIVTGWGENEGLLDQEFPCNPYDLYEATLPIGTLFLNWSEFGKTPYRYWLDHDISDVDNFLANCRPQRTFRAQFSLVLEPTTVQDFKVGFEKWFDPYRPHWRAQWNQDWTPLQEYGLLPLAHAVSTVPAQIQTVLSIKQCVLPKKSTSDTTKALNI